MRRAAVPRLQFLRILKFIVAAAGLAFFLFLPFAGTFFAAADPLQRGDVIVVLAGSRLDRWLEATDLYREGWAPKIVFSPGPVSQLEMKLRAEGMKFPREGDLARDAAVSLGIPVAATEVMREGVDNTAAEAAELHRMFPDGTIRRVIVVTSTYHVRRAGFAFRREFRNSGVEVLMRGSRYTSARPSRWWMQREDVRYLMSELPKYLAYVSGLGP